MEAFVMVFLLGVAFVVGGIYIRQGGYKRYYVTPNRSPGIAPYIPFGIATIVVSVSLLPFHSSELSDAILCTGIGLAVFGILYSCRNPRWLRPRWLVYLEDTYGWVLTYAHLLPRAGQAPGEWAQRMRTLDDVKRWAEEAAKEEGYYQPQQQGYFHPEREAHKLLETKEKIRTEGKESG